jgi:photosystem II stability/assembly factor-like uncharacterized protein
MTRLRIAGALAAAVAALLVAMPAPASVTTPKSGWSWGDPLPQGSPITSLTFSGARGYAAGGFGTVLRTDDGGSTWSGLRTGVTADLTDLTLISADSLVVGGGCVLRRSDDGGQTFQRLPFTPTDERCSSPLAATSFPSALVGYVVTADGTVLHSDDGGKTFGRRTAIPGTGAAGGQAQPTAIVFTSDTAGIAATSTGHLLSTTDGGNSWVDRATAPGKVNSLTVVAPGTVYAVGDASALLASTDGGVTWTPRAMTGAPGGLSLTGVSCTGTDLCVITTSAGDRILRTTDGGANASSVTPSTSPVFAAGFASATRVVAAGAAGATVLSDDAGVTFSPVGHSLDGVFSRLRVQAPQTVWATGSVGRLARSTDGGASWANVGVSTSENVIDAAFPTATTGYALDDSGTVLRSDNGGSSWRLLDIGSNRRPNALASPNANTVLLFGPRGILRSGDGGNQFDEVTARAVRRAPLSNYDRAGSALFAFGSKTLARSGDGGRTWTKLRLPTRRTSVVDADFITSTSGWLLAGGGRLYSTRNGGRRWTESLSVGDSRGQDISFGSARAGFVMVPDRGAGYVLRTSNGGATFAPQLVSKQALVPGGLVAFGASAAVALEEPSSVFFTTTGGGAGQIPKLTLSANHKRLRKAGSVKVTGRLSPAEGGEQMLVASRPLSSGSWKRQTVRVAANGSFTTQWRIRTATVFVAQWDGDDQRTGVGSSVLTVRVGRR